ncbi:hypothetical protein [Microcoleus vaginatus]|jgi:hypothetical protein|uniref:hypothetical protein n=1 Tax=Microcoleus vaginatus TaxID=119532 RepID=UPI00168913F7|nr:hypothetical protein [Microcoleus sp. FACHB-84]MBD2011735.1 hypothetical protein [Microcoleus sp. FACHB-45]
MTAFQLSLFPDEPPTPLDSLNKKRRVKLQSQPTVIEQSCTTHRAAQLLEVSTTTLYRARKEGKPYQKGAWTATAIGANAWTVVYNPFNSH